MASPSPNQILTTNNETANRNARPYTLTLDAVGIDCFIGRFWRWRWFFLWWWLVSAVPQYPWHPITQISKDSATRPRSSRVSQHIGKKMAVATTHIRMVHIGTLHLWLTYLYLS